MEHLLTTCWCSERDHDNTHSVECRSVKHTVHCMQYVYQCIGLLDSCQPVQFKLHTTPLNYSLPHYLAKSGPTRQQTQLVNSVKPGVALLLRLFSTHGNNSSGLG